MNIYYLGPAKTFSEQAAMLLGQNVSQHPVLTPLANFETVAKAVRDSAASAPSAGVLPYYNYLEGLVQEPLDLIYEYGLLIESAVRIPIKFSIGRAQGNSDQQFIYSHPKGLTQCSEYIQSHFPTLTTKPVTSTAESARLVHSTGEGLAIANREALLEYGLTIMDEDIGNRRQGRTNFTDFLLVTTEKRLPVDDTTPYRTMIAIVPHTDEIGLLANILGQAAFYNLNIAKIHSRPAINVIPVDIEPQMFYLELMCHPDSENLSRYAEALNYHFRASRGASSIVTVLGSFPALG